MNELDLTPEKELQQEVSSEASPMLILLGVLFVATALTAMISYTLEHDFLVLAGIFAPVFMGCFVLEYFDDVHFVLGNDCDIKPAPKPTLEEIMQVQPTAAELRARADAIDRSNNIIPPRRPKPPFGWTCSYCGTINVWKTDSEAELVRCAHCGARYEGDVLRELR